MERVTNHKHIIHIYIYTRAEVYIRCIYFMLAQYTGIPFIIAIDKALVRFLIGIDILILKRNHMDISP